MNLFDMFEEAPLEEKNSEEIESELELIFKKYNSELNLPLIREIASIFKDTPPWHPWN